jgi:hypothetical protein
VKKVKLENSTWQLRPLKGLPRMYNMSEFRATQEQPIQLWHCQLYVVPFALQSGVCICCRTRQHVHPLVSAFHVPAQLHLLLLLLLLQYVPESAKMVCGRLLVQMPPTQPQEAYDPAAYLPGIW